MQDVTEFIDLQTDMVWESVIECKEGRPKEIKAYLSEMKKLHVVLQREIFMRMIEYMSGRRKDITATYRCTYKAYHKPDREKNKSAVRYSCSKIL